MSWATIIPSFLLRTIDPRDIISRYVKGDFSKLIWNPSGISKIPTNTSTISILSIQSSNINDGVYAYRDRSDTIRYRVFSNQVNFECYLKGEDRELECENCGKMYKSSNQKGIPIQKTFFIENGCTFPVAYCEGSYCSTRCAYTGWVDEKRVSSKNFSSAIKNAEIILREIYAQECPGKILKTTNDRRLLKKFGGSLEYDEWIGDSEYSPCNIHLIPVKGMYAKQL